MVRRAHHIVDNALQRAIELCLAVYRITDKFPREEILGQKIRVKSIDIIEDLVYNQAVPTVSSRIFNFDDFEQKIRVLFAYFAVAEKQEWVDARNFGILREAYKNLYQNVKKVANVTGSDPVTNGVRPQGIKQQQAVQFQQKLRLSARQEKILGFLRAKEGGQAISDIAGEIQTSNKTAERELKKLIVARLARKHGNTRGAKFFAIA